MQKNWQTYAKHLLAEHKEDDDRCEWARQALNLAKNKAVDEFPIKDKIRGKPASHIAPTRIPDYIRKQIDQ